MNPKVDGYLRKTRKWREEIKKLRTVILGCGLTEELKWRIPCYSFQGKNIVAINGLKESCALAFFKGALLKDAHDILTKPGPNTQAGRWIKFTNVREIADREAILKAYIHEAVKVEQAGLKVKLKKTAELTIPEELQNELNKIPALNTAFHALTPGRQRAYVIYFSAGKQSKTRESRVEKCMKQILDGKGLNDDYISRRK